MTKWLSSSNPNSHTCGHVVSFSYWSSMLWVTMLLPLSLLRNRQQSSRVEEGASKVIQDHGDLQLPPLRKVVIQYVLFFLGGWRVSTRRTANTVGITRENILSNKVGMKMVYARWVPSLLSPDQKRSKFVISMVSIQFFLKVIQLILLIDLQPWVNLRFASISQRQQSKHWRYLTTPFSEDNVCSIRWQDDGFPGIPKESYWWTIRRKVRTLMANTMLICPGSYVGISRLDFEVNSQKDNARVRTCRHGCNAWLACCACSVFDRRRRQNCSAIIFQWLLHHRRKPSAPVIRELCGPQRGIYWKIIYNQLYPLSHHTHTRITCHMYDTSHQPASHLTSRIASHRVASHWILMISCIWI